MPENESATWLLSADTPSIQYQTLVDLSGLSANDTRVALISCLLCAYSTSWICSIILVFNRPWIGWSNFKTGMAVGLAVAPSANVPGRNWGIAMKPIFGYHSKPTGFCNMLDVFQVLRLRDNIVATLH